MTCCHTWSPPALVALQLRERPTCVTCYYCGCDLALLADDVVITPWGDVVIRPGCRLPTTDHKLPASRGGEDGLENVVLACVPCNSQKGAKTPDEYLDWCAERGDFDAVPDVEMIYGSGARFDRALREGLVAK